MARWMIYLKERFPLVTYGLLCAGLALSGLYAGAGFFRGDAFVVAMFGTLLFFFELRLMDELKDYEKDLAANPTRPLPRGLISTSETNAMINFIWFTMLGFAAVLYFRGNHAAGVSYLATTVWIWLMYREFFVGHGLANYPMIYAITHQFILLPICSFAVTAAHPEFYTSVINWGYGMTVLGAFFAYEICRKLDPAANPILQTYLYHYGAKKTAVLVTLVQLVAVFGAGLLGLSKLLLPFEILLVLSLTLLVLAPRKYKIVEGLAALSLVVHIWSVALITWMGW